jgi:surface antigen
MTIGEKIALTASKYVGQRETLNNSGFKDKELEKRMKEVGWSVGLSWCVYFAELCFKEAYAGNVEMQKRLSELFSGSATATYKNFDLNKLFTVNQQPSIGAVMIFRQGNGWQGHACIVEKIDGNNIHTIEGNTGENGSREGIMVARKIRKLKKPYTSTGLNLVGFIHPMQ